MQHLSCEAGGKLAVLGSDLEPDLRFVLLPYVRNSIMARIKNPTKELMGWKMVNVIFPDSSIPKFQNPKIPKSQNYVFDMNDFFECFGIIYLL